MAQPPAAPNPLRPFLVLGVLVLATAILYWAQTVLIPVALAILLTFVLTPAVIFFQRRGLKRVFAVLVVTAITFALIGGLIYGLVEEVNGLSKDVAAQSPNISRKIAELQGSGQGMFANFFKFFEAIGKGLDKAFGQANPVEQGPGKPLPVRVVNSKPAISWDWFPSVARPALEFLAQFALVLILVIFMLLRREDLRDRLLRLIGHGRLTVTTRALDDAATRISSYLLMQLSINAGLGLALAIGLWFLSVPYAFLWGLITAVLRFIPYVGSWLSALLPITISFALSQGWVQPISVLILFASLELLTANVVEPLLFSHSTGISSIALLVAAAFWTWLWGPIGLVLSAPLTVCLGVLGRYVPPLEFFDILLGDEEVLDPKIRYYQRLLARDQDEAHEVVEDYLAHHSYEQVYDDILLPALLFAKRDQADRGLAQEDVAFIYQVTRDVLENVVAPQQEISLIAAGVSAGPAGNGQPPQVLILGCPVRDQADEVALEMFAQLLRSRPSRIEVMSSQMLTPEVLAKVQQERPAVVCLGALPPGGIAQARFLCKRLREARPELKIMVGRWGQTENVQKVQERLRAAGADFIATSFLESRIQVSPLLEPTTLAAAPSARPAAVPGNR